MTENAWSGDAKTPEPDLKTSTTDMVATDTATGEPSSDDVAALHAEVEKLRTENEELKSSAPPANRTATVWRWVATVLLVVFGSLVAFGAIGAFWVNRFIMDTNTFVSTVSPLAQDPSFQKAVTDGVDNAIFTNVNVQAQITTILTALQQLAVKQGVNVGNLPIQALAAPIAGSIEQAVRTQTANLVASPQFQQLFDESLRAGHQAFLSAVNGTQQASDNGLISFQGDIVYLNVNAFANAVKTRLVSSGFTFLQNIPLTRAQGQIKLVESPALITALATIRTLNVMAWVLPLLALVLLAGAVLTAPDRRRGLLYVAIGLIVVTLIGLVGIDVGRAGVASVASTSGPAAAAVVAAYDILPRGLVTLLRLVLGVSILLLIGAVLTGPARWAVTMRTWMAGLANGSGSGARTAGFITKWRTPLAGGGVLLGILAVIAFPVTAVAVFWIGVVVLLWVFVVEAIGRGGRPAGTPPAAHA